MDTTISPLSTGTTAPDFTARTTDGEEVTLSDFRGRQAVLLMFYPKDDTSGCTKQMCTARDEGAAYRDAGVARFGLSTDDMESHLHFRDKFSLDFPLIVDEDGRVASAYGVLREDGYAQRATYLIDRDGRIVYAELGAHGADEVLGALRG